MDTTASAPHRTPVVNANSLCQLNHQVGSRARTFSPKDLIDQFVAADHSLDPCAASPCLNQAQCMSNGMGGFTCLCLPGFTGSRCEQKLPCSSNPCLNGGVCVPTGFGYRCDCPLGVSGFNCETSKYFLQLILHAPVPISISSFSSILPRGRPVFVESVQK